MIVAAQPEAAEAGARVLQRGGNAVDAAVAAAFTQCVVDPLMSGIAGYGTMQVSEPNGGAHTCIDFCARAPLAITPDIWADKRISETSDGYAFVVEGNLNDAGYLSIGTPGTLAGLEHALRRFGTLDLADVLADAIGYARNGFRMRPHMYHYCAIEQAKGGMMQTPQRLKLSSTGRRVYFREDGSSKRLGDVIVNPDYADTLERIARAGIDTFYRGEIAEQIDADMRKHGGLLSRRDLATYAVREVAPIWSTYRGFDIAGFPPPAAGLTLIQSLNILECFDLRGMGHNTPAYLTTLAETLKRVTIDKDTLIGDPEFVDVPVEMLASKAHARKHADAIRAGERANVARIDAGAEPKDTTQVCVIDRNGMAVTLTHTLGTNSGVITDGLGFLYNGLISGFDPRPGRPGSISPGKSRTSAQCPTILFRNGAPVVAIGAPGGTAINPALTQSIVNVVDFDMPIVEAVSAPRVSVTSNVIEVSNRIPRYVTDVLESDGYPVTRSPMGFAFAAPHAITRLAGRLAGAADPQRDGVALAVAHEPKA
ncbi:gamma-glutamyltransferase 1 Threonine peptidase. MEROPS family T03 [Chitinasiproducens palmae]|uniref:Glutathione hydrolase proenzyme n=2 Tax=Chitinasiproducens palmae TaxID=1770053 RepID=A0A1H2PQU6_9BURK|nr:gamma-glutamyltransferase 1 Threonine peptidase. MEROPS family T03 [Chitinasiproducens palmae]